VTRATTAALDATTNLLRGATRPYSHTRPQIWFALIDQSTRVELAINLRIAKTLAVKMPQLLLRG